MAQEYGVRCRHCLTWVDTRDHPRRCPRCGEDLTMQRVPDLPPGLRPSDAELEGPEFPEDGRRQVHETAPLSEFLAAGSLLGGLVMLVVGALVGSPTVMLVGFVGMLAITAFFAIFGKNRPFLRTLQESRYLYMPRWMFRGERDRDRD